MTKRMRTSPKQFGRVQNHCESVRGQGIKGQLISKGLLCFFNSSKKRTKNFCCSRLGQTDLSLQFFVKFWVSQRNWPGLLIPVSLLPETPIEVILLRVLFTAKVLTNLRWQGRGGGGARRGGGGGSRVAGDPMKGVLS